MLRKVWEGSGKVYGYRKLHDDLLDHGETCCRKHVRNGMLSPVELENPQKTQPESVYETRGLFKHWD